MFLAELADVCICVSAVVVLVQVFQPTANASLVLLCDLQQLHARSLDGVEDLPGQKGRRVSASELHTGAPIIFALLKA